MGLIQMQLEINKHQTPKVQYSLNPVHQLANFQLPSQLGRGRCWCESKRKSSRSNRRLKQNQNQKSRKRTRKLISVSSYQICGHIYADKSIDNFQYHCKFDNTVGLQVSLFSWFLIFANFLVKKISFILSFSAYFCQLPWFHTFPLCFAYGLSHLWHWLFKSDVHNMNTVVWNDYLLIF